MTIILGWLQLLILGTVTYYEYKKKAPVVFCWATLLLMFGIMHVFTVYLGEYKYGSCVLNEASVFVFFFCAIYLIVRIIFRNAFRCCLCAKSNGHSKFDLHLLNLINIILFLSVALYGFFVIKTSGSLMAISKDNVYKTMAIGSKWFLLSSYLYYSSAPIILYYIIKKNKAMVIYSGALIIIRSFLSQSRMDMIIIFVGCIYAIILKQKKKDIKRIILLGVMAIVVIYAIYAMRTFRYYYSFSDLIGVNMSEFNGRLLEFIKNDDGELGLRQVFYYFIDNDNKFSGFGTGKGYIRVMMLPIPSRFAFGLKPEDMCLVMGRAWRPDAHGIINFTVTPTLFGDCYSNLGFWGCILGAFWAFLASIVDVLCNRKNEIIKYLLLCMCATLFVDIGRGSIYNPLVIIYYSSIFVLGYRILSRIKVCGCKFSFFKRTNKLVKNEK